MEVVKVGEDNCVIVNNSDIAKENKMSRVCPD